MHPSISSRSRRPLGVALLLLAAGWAGSALAQAAPEEPDVPAQARPQQEPRPSLAEFTLSRRDGRGPFALLLQVGPFSGFGGGVAVGTAEAGLRASVGWSPVLLLLDRGSGNDLQFYGGLQVSPDLYVRLLHPRPTTHVGLQGGYRYSSLLGHGGAAGAYVQFAIGRAFDALVAGGFVFYPDGEDHLRKDQNLSTSTSFSFPGPSVNFGISLGLAFFP